MLTDQTETKLFNELRRMHGQTKTPFELTSLFELKHPRLMDKVTTKELFVLANQAGIKIIREA